AAVSTQAAWLLIIGVHREFSSAIHRRTGRSSWDRSGSRPGRGAAFAPGAGPGCGPPHGRRRTAFESMRFTYEPMVTDMKPRCLTRTVAIVSAVCGLLTLLGAGAAGAAPAQAAQAMPTSSATARAASSSGLSSLL